MTLASTIWLQYFSEKTKIPIPNVARRVRIQYWKDMIEVFDLGVFVPIVLAEDDPKLELRDYGIVLRKPKAEVQPNVDSYGDATIYTYDHYFRVILLAEYGDRLKILDRSGNPVQLREHEKQLFLEKKENYLRAARLK